LNVAVIGAGWIGGIHCECYERVNSMMDGVRVRLHTVVDIIEPAAVKAKERFGFLCYSTDWHDVTDSDEIDVIDVCIDNIWHKDIVIAAIAGGKQVICEKPLATSLDDAEEMVSRAEEAGIVNLINFNYRRVPAIAQIKALIESGELGVPYHIKGVFLQDFGLTSPMSWRFQKDKAGAGSIVTMGAHLIDLGRFLMGDYAEVCALGATVIPERVVPATGEMGKCDVDDAMTFMARFNSGAIGMFMTSWVCHGRKHHCELEIYCEKGSMHFNSERLNELKLCLADDGHSGGLNGFRNVLVGADGPYGDLFNLKTGMGIGIKESFTLQIREALRAIADGGSATPDFRDGMICEKVTDAIVKSTEAHTWVKID